MNDFGPKRPMSESAETAPTDTAKAKRGRPKKKPDYDRENVRKKACTRLTCSRICDILESWETVALAALIIANLYTVSSRQQSKDRLRCEEEYNGLKYMKNIDACKRWRGHRRGKTETDTASEPENPEREDAPRSCVAHGTVLSGRD